MPKYLQTKPGDTFQIPDQHLREVITRRQALHEMREEYKKLSMLLMVTRQKLDEKEVALLTAKGKQIHDRFWGFLYEILKLNPKHKYHFDDGVFTVIRRKPEKG